MNHTKKYKTLFRECRGTAGIEMACIFPTMIALWFGCIEIVDYIQADSLLSQAASAMVKEVAQQTVDITPSSLADMCVGIKMTLSSIPTTSLSADVADVSYQSDGTFNMNWEGTHPCPTPATAMGATTAITTAQNAGVLPVINTSVIIMKISLNYSSPIQFFSFGYKTLTQTVYAHPRGNQSISATCSSSNPC
jgi:Flp pilus assembly protein TadG